jgi:hypothetical protein
MSLKINLDYNLKLREKYSAMPAKFEGRTEQDESI